MSKKPRKKRPLTSSLHIQLEIYREKWIVQEQMDAVFPTAQLPNELNEAEISSARSCIEAMIRYYKVPLRSLCLYLEETPETLQDWKRGRVPPTRIGTRKLQFLVKELDQAKLAVEGPPPPPDPNRVRHIPESFRSLRMSGHG